jgi:hypothetical protein
MQLGLFGHLGAVATPLAYESGTAAARGDGGATLVLIGVIVAVICLMVAIAGDKKELPPGKATPRTGRYEATLKATAYSGGGRPLPPPKERLSEEGNWKLVDAHTSERWLLVVILLCVLGGLAYSQVDIPRLQEAVAHSVGPVAAPPPHTSGLVDHRGLHHSHAHTRGG